MFKHVFTAIGMTLSLIMMSWVLVYIIEGLK